MKCRHCKGTSFLPFIDLGAAPPSNAYLSKEDLKGPEKTYPLRVCVCDQCWLTQTEDFANSEELFDENYAYFSSTSSSWLKHAEKYVSDMIERFHLDSQSHVVEIASNDGYLLQYIQKAGIPCIGIEPTASTANESMKKGINVISEFFGESLGLRMAKDGKKADLTIANNVLAHVPDINDFVAGFSQILKDDGVSTFEFPHLVRLVEENQFDTIYHEHFSYISLTAATKIFVANGLTIFDVEELPTHGGSLRIYAQKSNTGIHKITNRLTTLLMLEEKIGVNSALYYSKLQKNSEYDNIYLQSLQL
jgi:SAM-dependent methyltransferase